MIDNITGIILVGGKSRRIGQDKSFLLLDGKPLIEIMLDKMSTLFKDLLIITDKPKAYQKYGIKICPDIIAERGPLGGIYTGLVNSESMHNFIVACDTPFLNPDLVQYMAQEINGFDVVVARNQGRLEPLCAVYSKNCIKPIESELSKNNLKIRDFFPQVKVRIITEEEIARFDSQGFSFINVNTPKDYRKIATK